MNPDQVKKINDLARSLKENRLAANLEEAMDMAKRMLLSEGKGEQRTEHQLDVEQKLGDIVDTHHDKEAQHMIDETKEAVEKDAKALEKDAKELEDLKNQMLAETAELELLKKDIEAIKDIVDSAPEAAEELEREVKQEELTEKRHEE